MLERSLPCSLVETQGQTNLRRRDLFLRRLSEKDCSLTHGKSELQSPLENALADSDDHPSTHGHAAG